MLEESRVQPHAAPGAVRPALSLKANPQPVLRRARLNDLNSHLHCSIIGTCLSTAELRKLVPRFKELDRERATDVEIHHAAVELAGENGAGAKALHKSLDDRHELAIRKFREAGNESDLRRIWQQSLASGEIPGAYWALMTHPAVTTPLRHSAFGEVHMLSHLVGAANRADIRRLLALEHENAELKSKVSCLQERLQEINTLHLLEIQRRSDQTDTVAADPDPGAEHPSQDLLAEIAELKSRLAAKERALAHQTKRRGVAEQGLEQQLETTRVLSGRLDGSVALADALNSELNAMETTLVRRLESSVVESAAGEFLKNKRVLYVGGRPASNRAIKSLVESACGELSIHDGGIEDRKGLLVAAMPSADLVVFPVDCIDHDSMSTLKRVCERHGVPFHPLRSASVASFSALVARLALSSTEPDSPFPVTHICMRHG
jgi:hypothetical protein